MHFLFQKQNIFNTRDAESSACISRGTEISTLSITGTKTYQLIFIHYQG